MLQEKIKKTICFLNNYATFFIVYVLFLFFTLLPYYFKGTLILGGEGNFVLDYFNRLCKYGFVWFHTYGLGIPNMSPSMTGINIILLYLIERLTNSILFANFILIFSIYLFPFLGMYLLCKEIKTSAFISFIISLFYIINPFVIYYLASSNQWNVFSMAVMPFLFVTVLKHYKDNFKLFFYFGLSSSLFSFTYSNPPTLVVVIISVVFSIFVISYYLNKMFKFVEIFKKAIIIFLSFVAFNIWWILIIPAGILNTASKIYSPKWAYEWLVSTLDSHGALIAKMFLLTVTIGRDPSYDFFSFWYNMPIVRIIALIPFILIIYFTFSLRDKKEYNILKISIFCVLLIVLFFVKGVKPPFGFIYDFMFKNIPLFCSFKTPVDKFGILYVFIFTILILLFMKDIKELKHHRYILGIFMVYLVFCSVPIITGNIISDYKNGDLGYCSRRYKEKAEYRKIRDKMNKNVAIYRIISFPTSGLYQVCFKNYDNKYYTGLDPLLMNINKPFITETDIRGVDLLYQDISSVNYGKLLGLYSIKKIIINKDLIPWFSTKKIVKNSDKVETIFNKSFKSEKYGDLIIYENEEYFSPFIYVSRVIDS